LSFGKRDLLEEDVPLIATVATSSLSELELSTTICLFLLFLLALKAISYFLVVVMPLERFLTWLASSIYIS
jgi:hypothetical protein